MDLDWDGARAAAPDGGRLHGAARACRRCAASWSRTACAPTRRRRSSQQGTTRDAARGHRNAAPRCRSCAAGAKLHAADADHRRRRRAAARAARLVRGEPAAGRGDGVAGAVARAAGLARLVRGSGRARTSPRRGARPRTPRPRRASAGPSFDRMWRTCSLTVSWLMSSACAIALLLLPLRQVLQDLALALGQRLHVGLARVLPAAPAAAGRPA